MLIEGCDYGKKALMSALGLTSDWHEPRWPLPNLTPTNEASFWGHQTSYGPIAKMHVMGQKVDGKHVDLFIYRMPDVYSWIDGGFVVVVGRYEENPRVRYFEWRACEHDFKCVESRNCYRKYECKKCGKGYDEHSD